MEIVNEGWGETHDGTAQCAYTLVLEGGRYSFLIRRMGSDFLWSSINLSIPGFGVGQIMVSGQSDTDCYSRTEKILEAIFGRK